MSEQRQIDALAAFVAGTPATAVPAQAIDCARLALVDFIGVAVAGSVEPVTRIIARHAARSSTGVSTLIGHAHRAAAAEAALCNGAAGHALDFDDSSFVQGGHPSAVLLPAVLAVGEERHSTGRDVLEAYVIGYEVLMKLARAVNFEHYYKGWHPTATLGVFGAAAAVARLLRLDAERVCHALGIAASMASGVKANFGSYTKPFQVGHAAHKGVLSAVLAADGLTASADALEGKQGFAEVYNGSGKYDFANVAFSDTLEIVEPGLRFKRYACCGSTHSSIDAALDLRRGREIRPKDIAQVSVAIEKRRARHTDRPQYAGGYQGKFSLQYLLAAALTDGEISVGHFTDESTARADLRALAARVTVIPVDRGESLSDFCELEVTLNDGTKRSLHRDSAEGRTAAEYPRCMREKFLDCVGQLHDRGRAEALLESLLAFDGCLDVAGILRQIGAPAERAAASQAGRGG